MVVDVSTKLRLAEKLFARCGHHLERKVAPSRQNDRLGAGERSTVGGRLPDTPSDVARMRKQPPRRMRRLFRQGVVSTVSATALRTPDLHAHSKARGRTVPLNHHKSER
jgi:hypothetical protein